MQENEKGVPMLKRLYRRIFRHYTEGSRCQQCSPINGRQCLLSLQHQGIHVWAADGLMRVTEVKW